MAHAENTTPVDAVIVEGGDGTQGVVVTLPEGSGEAAPPEVVETVTDSAVEIARIEADRDVAVATLQSESAERHHEIEAEARSEERDEEWRTELNSLREGQAALGDALASMAPLLEGLEAWRLSTLPPSPEADPSSPPPVVEEAEPSRMTDTPETPPETSSETRTEAPERNGAESPAPARRRHRMI